MIRLNDNIIKDVYSKEERIIGISTDGKAIYRTIYKGNIENWQKIFSNVDTIYNLSGYGFLGNNTRKVILNGLAADTPNTLFSCFFAIDNTLEFYAKYGGSTTTAYNCTIILEYTKTTD